MSVAAITTPRPERRGGDRRDAAGAHLLHEVGRVRSLVRATAVIDSERAARLEARVARIEAELERLALEAGLEPLPYPDLEE